MPDYTTLTIRPAAEQEYQRMKFEWEKKNDKKISTLDFFEMIMNKFKEGL